MAARMRLSASTLLIESPSTGPYLWAKRRLLGSDCTDMEMIAI